MHNNLPHWLYDHLEGVIGSTTAAVYGYISFKQGFDEALFRIGIALICGFVGAAGAWLFKKVIDKFK